VYLHLAVEDELDPLRRAQLRPHLESCTDCDRRHRELLDEKRWLLAGMLRAPQLPGHFAGSLCARLEAEGATPFDLADPDSTDPDSTDLDSTDLNGTEKDAQRSEAGSPAETSVARPRRWTVYEAIPWLSAAAVAVFLAALAGVLERAPRSSTVHVARPPQNSSTTRSSTTDVTGVAGVASTIALTSKLDGRRLLVNRRAGLTGAGLTGAGLTGAGLTGAGLTGAGLTGAGLTGAGQASTHVIRSSSYCSLDRPRPLSARSCPQIDVFLDTLQTDLSIVGAPSSVVSLPNPQPMTHRIEVVVRDRRIPNDATTGLADATAPIALHTRESSRHFGQVFGLMARLSRDREHEPVSTPGREEKDPCAQDPNEDGELDIVDVTHLCQQIMQPNAMVTASSLALPTTPGTIDPDCHEEEDCL